jgi:hypothetical protein
LKVEFSAQQNAEIAGIQTQLEFACDTHDANGILFG